MLFTAQLYATSWKGAAASAAIATLRQEKLNETKTCYFFFPLCFLVNYSLVTYLAVIFLVPGNHRQVRLVGGKIIETSKWKEFILFSILLLLVIFPCFWLTLTQISFCLFLIFFYVFVFCILSRQGLPLIFILYNLYLLLLILIFCSLMVAHFFLLLTELKPKIGISFYIFTFLFFCPISLFY